MRVLIVYAQPVFWSMGDERGAAIFTRLPEAIAARGHEVRISLPAAAGVAVDRSENGEPWHGCFLHREATRRGFVPAADRPLPARLYNRAARWLAYQRWGYAMAGTLAERFPPDLVIGMGTYEAPVARRLGRALGVPNITRLFGNSLSLHLHDPIRFHLNFPEVIAFRTPADLIVLNDDGADGEAVARKLRVPAERFLHMRNGVDYDLFFPGPGRPEIRAALGIRPEQPMLLTVTRLAPEKKLTRAIDALRDLLRLCADATLVLLGEGPETDSLRAYARESGVASSVFFPGPIRQSELPDWYRSADVVLSLLDRTNAANPVFEAMACGRVVVALDAGTTGRVVRDDDTGVLLARADLARAGSILGALLANEERMRQLGENARRAIPALVMDLRRRLEWEVEMYEAVAEGRLPGTSARDVAAAILGRAQR